MRLKVLQALVAGALSAFACTEGDVPSAAPELAADVFVIEDQIVVTNEDTLSWAFPIVELNGAYRTRADEVVGPGLNFTLDVREFANNDGMRFDLRTMKVVRACVYLDTSDVPMMKYCKVIDP